jgi:hypothetical protein
VWFGLPLGYKIDIASITTLDDWLLFLSSMGNIRKCDLGDFFCWIAFSLWNLWKARCEAVYEHDSPNPIAVISRICSAVFEFLQLHHVVNCMPLILLACLPQILGSLS